MTSTAKNIVASVLAVSAILGVAALFVSVTRSREGGLEEEQEKERAIWGRSLEDKDLVQVKDNIEELVDYGPVGPRYSNIMRQALSVLLKKMPPRGRKLLVIATTSRKQVLDDLEMIPAFNDVVHVPNLSKQEHVSAVARASKVIPADGVKQLESQLLGRTFN